MRPPDVKRPESAATRSGREDGQLERRAGANNNTASLFRVILKSDRGGTIWAHGVSRDFAERVAARLRQHGFDASVERTE